ncbi:MAG: hypothetical protein WCL39_11375, partial [Armatimonadota bacterium]
AYSGSNVAANIAKAVAAITRARDGHVALKLEYQRLWLEENRPYYLSTNLKKYDVLINRYNEILAYLTKSGPLSSPVDIGLTLVSLSQRPTSPKAVVSTPLDSGLSWSYPLYNRRIGLDLPMPTEVTSEEPVEVVLPATVGQPSGYQLVFIDPVTNTQYPINSQISLVSSSAKIAFIAPRVGIYQSRKLLLYYGSGSQTAIARTKIAAKTLTAPTSYTNVVTAGTNGMIWVDNGVIRVLIGPEGAHIYRWEIKSMSNRDITEPGEKTWQGFADINGANRSAINTLTIVEQGPSLVRIRSLDAYGMQKTLHIWAGVPWVEVTLNTLSTWFCTYDDITLLGANTLTPGKCIFSDGYSEPIRPWSNTNYRDSEVRRDYVTWGAKYNLNSIVLGLLTPDVVASHTVGPGYDGGGPRLEWKVPATHFVIYGDKCPADPALEMNAIGRALDYRKTIKVTIYASENQPG